MKLRQAKKILRHRWSDDPNKRRHKRQTVSSADRRARRVANYEAIQNLMRRGWRSKVSYWFWSTDKYARHERTAAGKHAGSPRLGELVPIFPEILDRLEMPPDETRDGYVYGAFLNYGSAYRDESGAVRPFLDERGNRKLGLLGEGGAPLPPGTPPMFLWFAKSKA